MFERLESCFPVIVSPWQMINLLSHFSDVDLKIFLGIVFSLVSKATDKTIAAMALNAINEF